MKPFKFVNSPRLFLLSGVFGIMSVFASQIVSAGIESSRHDLRSFLGLGATGEICVVCHTPHDARNSAAGDNNAPLWNHEETTATFEMYNNLVSSTLDGAVDEQPTGASKLCLSCHDGTVGIDNYGGGANTGAVLDPENEFFVGTSLVNQHPISITYDAAADPGLVPPTEVIIIGGYDPGSTGAANPTKRGTIGDLLIPDGKVQCSSCHDVHNTFVASSTAMLRVSNVGSGLCLTCHNK